MVNSNRGESPFIRSLCIACCLVTFSSIGVARAVDENTAREQAKSAVRMSMHLPATHFLKATRSEELEEELFSFQAKIAGQIAFYTYFYEVTETGYEIISPNEVLLHKSTDGTRKWIVAISREQGHIYPLYGFEKATEEFNRLASDALVRIESEDQAKSYTEFFWKTTLGADYGILIQNVRDLKRQVDDVLYGYRLTTGSKVTLESWWKGFESSAAKPQFGVNAVKANGTYLVKSSQLKVPASKIPIVQNLTVEIIENGRIGGLQVQTLYPIPTGTGNK